MGVGDVPGGSGQRRVAVAKRLVVGLPTHVELEARRRRPARSRARGPVRPGGRARSTATDRSQSRRATSDHRGRAPFPRAMGSVAAWTGPGGGRSRRSRPRGSRSRSPGVVSDSMSRVSSELQTSMPPSRCDRKYSPEVRFPTRRPCMSTSPTTIVSIEPSATAVPRSSRVSSRQPRSYILAVRSRRRRRRRVVARRRSGPRWPKAKPHSPSPGSKARQCRLSRWSGSAASMLLPSGYRAFDQGETARSFDGCKLNTHFTPSIAGTTPRHELSPGADLHE